MGMSFRPWSGYVTLEARDAASGELVDRIVRRNAYTNVAAIAYGSALAGGTASLTISHIDVGTGGYSVATCDSTTGWAGSGLAADTSIYREGSGALKGTAAASGTTVYYHATSAGGTAILGSTGAVEFYLRLTSRSATSLANSRVRFYSAGGTANYYDMSLANAETAGTVTYADTTWAKARIPTASGLWTTYGSPSWDTITGCGVVVGAAGAGTATIHWDQFLGLPYLDTAGTALATLTATPGSRGQRAITDVSASSGGTVLASAAWTDAELVGDFYYAGLYARSGATLLAVAPLTYYKAAGVVLTLTWTGVVTGG